MNVFLSPVGDGDAYRDLLLRGTTRRFTAYVGFPDHAEELTPNVALVLELVERNRAGVEEIDVDAATELHAREIARAAIARDYQPGGVILSVEERHGWYL